MKAVLILVAILIVMAAVLLVYLVIDALLERRRKRNAPVKPGDERLHGLASEACLMLVRVRTEAMSIGDPAWEGQVDEVLSTWYGQKWKPKP